MKIFKKHAVKFEQTSVDEAYLEVSPRIITYLGANRIAHKIQKEVLEKEGLTCSVGIGPNKLIAKIASDMKKPEGVTIIKPHKVRNFLDPLKIRKIPGVGPKTAAHLNERHIFKIEDLSRLPKQRLIDMFGVHGGYLYFRSRGIDNSEVNNEWVPKSFGHRTTFMKDTKDQDIIFGALAELVKNALKRMRKIHDQYKTITVTVRYKDFETKTKAKTLRDWHSDETTAQILARHVDERVVGADG